MEEREVDALAAELGLLGDVVVSRLLAEGAADAATIDAVLRDAGGFRMGPFELMDLIGHDVNFAVTQSVFAAYFNDPRFTPSVLQRELVDAGFLGRKTGRGCYVYGGVAAAITAQAEAPQPVPDYVSYTQEAGAVAAAAHPHGGMVTDALAARLRAAGIAVAHRKPLESHGKDDAPAFHCNGAAVYLTDGRIRQPLTSNCTWRSPGVKCSCSPAIRNR